MIGNTIANNLGNGVSLRGAPADNLQNSIDSNSIYNNALLGISLETTVNNNIQAPQNLVINSADSTVTGDNVVPGAIVQLFADSLNKSKFKL